MQIRRVHKSESKKYFRCLKNIDKETKFMMFEPDERQFDEKRITEALDEKDDCILGAFDNEDIVGFLSAKRGVFRRIHHSAYIVIGIRADFQGQGIGSKLFDELDKWSKENGLKRLELTVDVSNVIAIKLYKSKGFQIEGTKKNAMIVDGKSVDEYMMAKLY